MARISFDYSLKMCAVESSIAATCRWYFVGYRYEARRIHVSIFYAIAYPECCHDFDKYFEHCFLSGWCYELAFQTNALKPDFSAIKHPLCMIRQCQKARGGIRSPCCLGFVVGYNFNFIWFGEDCSETSTKVYSVHCLYYFFKVSSQDLLNTSLSLYQFLRFRMSFLVFHKRVHAW